MAFFLSEPDCYRVSHLVDWKRGLGMQLWYSSAKGDRTQAFSNALDQYDQAVSSSRARYLNLLMYSSDNS